MPAGCDLSVILLFFWPHLTKPETMWIISISLGQLSPPSYQLLPPPLIHVVVAVISKLRSDVIMN